MAQIHNPLGQCVRIYQKTHLNGAFICEGQSGEERVPEPAKPRRLRPGEPALAQLGHQERNSRTVVINDLLQV